mmetsp:Transcript_144860/g.367631  ORF Transcript_144860/g.367631 Transcript_144860/m.367631 type:complete len:281 (+) Transcript_144860:688-1530(+)
MGLLLGSRDHRQRRRGRTSSVPGVLDLYDRHDLVDLPGGGALDVGLRLARWRRGLFDHRHRLHGLCRQRHRAHVRRSWSSRRRGCGGSPLGPLRRRRVLRPTQLASDRPRHLHLVVRVVRLQLRLHARHDHDLAGDHGRAGGHEHDALRGSVWLGGVGAPLCDLQEVRHRRHVQWHPRGLGLDHRALRQRGVRIRVVHRHLWRLHLSGHLLPLAKVADRRPYRCLCGAWCLWCVGCSCCSPFRLGHRHGLLQRVERLELRRGGGRLCLGGLGRGPRRQYP